MHVRARGYGVNSSSRRRIESIGDLSVFLNTLLSINGSTVAVLLIVIE